MKIFIIFLASLYASEAFVPKSVLTEKWDQFKLSNGRSFIDSKEEHFRKGIFQKKIQHIEEHNERYRQGLETYELGVNKFTDYTEEELLPYTHGLQVPIEEPEPLISISANSSFNARTAVPSSFDWRDSGMVTPVKSQGGCGSCWTFSTTGALESHYKIRTGLTVSLSEQQLVDCVYPRSGCNGGWMHSAYTYIANKGGINYDTVYPYEGVYGPCRYSPSKSKITIAGYANLKSPDEATLQHIVATQGPVSVAIDASGDFSAYSGGVYYSSSCSTSTFNHAVVVVGYGSENGNDYWLVKNSWGRDWGLNGYIKMARNRGNHCGIASKASYPVF